MSGFEEMAPLYDVPADAVAVVLLRGPLDGEERRVPVAGRSEHVLMVSLMSYWLPLPPRLDGRPVTDEEVFRWPPEPRQAGYGLMLDAYGQPSRDDAGRLRLEFRGLL